MITAKNMKYIGVNLKQTSEKVSAEASKVLGSVRK
jgi:hypothetical protein